MIEINNRFEIGEQIYVAHKDFVCDMLFPLSGVIDSIVVVNSKNELRYNVTSGNNQHLNCGEIDIFKSDELDELTEKCTTVNSNIARVKMDVMQTLVTSITDQTMRNLSGFLDNEKRKLIDKLVDEAD